MLRAGGGNDYAVDVRIEKLVIAADCFCGGSQSQTLLQDFRGSVANRGNLGQTALRDYFKTVPTDPAHAEKAQTMQLLLFRGDVLCCRGKCLTHTLPLLSGIRQDEKAWPRMLRAGPLEGKSEYRAFADRRCQ